MYSNKLTQLIQAATASPPTEVHRAALKSLTIRLNADVKNCACFRCEEADWLMTWQPLPEAPDGDCEWLLVLGRCGKYINLSGRPDGGLAMPTEPFPFCSAMIAGG
jgi:hypothetical protein